MSPQTIPVGVLIWNTVVIIFLAYSALRYLRRACKCSRKHATTKKLLTFTQIFIETQKETAQGRVHGACTCCWTTEMRTEVFEEEYEKLKTKLEAKEMS